MEHTYFWLIVSLVTSVLILDLLADGLNLKSFSRPIPEEFKESVSPEQIAKSRAYFKDGFRYGCVKRLIQWAAFVAFFVWGGFEKVDQLARSFGWSEIATGLVFVSVLSVLKGALALPFSIYHTFVLEERHGFNRTTPATFVGDLIKGTILGAVLGLPIFALICWFFQKTGSLAWLYAWLGLSAIQVLLTFLAPVVILPLFNRFAPLQDPALQSAVDRYLRTQRFEIQGIYTMDGSKRSAKANAFFTGFGRFRRLVLFDTLLQKHTQPELVAVFAHEVGHFKLGHIPRSMLLSLFSSGLMFLTFSLFIGNPEFSAAFQMRELSVYSSLVFIMILYSPILRLLGIGSLWLSRKYEFEADAFAKKTTGNAEALAQALKKLSLDNLSHLTPHPLKVWLDYSHPPVAQRIAALRESPRSGI